MKIFLFLVIVQSILPQGHMQTCGKVTDLEVTVGPLRRKYFDFLQNTTNTYESAVPKDKYDVMALSLQRECNWHTTEPYSSRLYGGELAAFKPFPWIVQMESMVFCSGIILNRFWILGADYRRCIGDMKCINYGSNVTLRTTMDKQIVLPPSFNISGCGIALTKTKDNMRDGKAYPVCLPWIKTSFTDCYAVSVGLSSEYPKVFRVVHTPQPVCEYFFKCRNITLGKNIICFRLTNATYAFDDGDHGTPIVCNFNTSWKRPYVVGVYRFMQVSNAYRIFYNVNVEYYIKWIIDTLVNNS